MLNFNITVKVDKQNITLETDIWNQDPYKRLISDTISLQSKKEEIERLLGISVSEMISKKIVQVMAGQGSFEIYQKLTS